VIEVFVHQLTWESDDVLGVLLEDASGAPLPEWQPGAHIGVELPGGTRHYSLCGRVDDRSRYRILVLREPASRGGSTFVHERLRPGDVLQISEPSNHFPLDAAPGYRFLAGGIGITPLVPMLHATAAASSPSRMLYVGGSRYTMALVDELEGTPHDVSVVARDEAPRPDLSDYLSAPAEGELLYVCGPPALVEAAATAAAASGWPEAAVRSERFVPVDLDPADEDDFTVLLAASGTSASVPAEASLVDVLERSGIDVESACREGICGTCQVSVVSGEIIHRDAVLSAAERASGTTMMACVSRGRGQLVLDL